MIDFHKFVQRARKSSVISEERARKSIQNINRFYAIKDKDTDLAGAVGK